jgi:predicted DNA-binding transcriptional regulator AlpA
MKGLVRISEFATISGLKVSTLYVYHAHKAYNFPSPDLSIGVVHFWRRAKAAAWAREHKKRNGR